MNTVVSIEGRLDSTLEEAKALYEGFKMVLHDINLAKEMWVKRVKRAEKVLSRLDENNQDVGQILLNQAREYVDYYEKNRVIQQDKVSSLKGQLKQLKDSKKSLDADRERLALYERVNAIAVGSRPRADALDGLAAEVPDYRRIQSVIMETNALIELKNDKTIQGNDYGA